MDREEPFLTGDAVHEHFPDIESKGRFAIDSSTAIHPAAGRTIRTASLRQLGSEMHIFTTTDILISFIALLFFW